MRQSSRTVAIILRKYNPFGGYERQALLLAKAMITKGYRVTVFTNSWPKDEQRGLEIRHVPCINICSWIRTLSFAYFVEKKLKNDQQNYSKVISFDRVFSADIYRAGNACHRAWLDFRMRNESWRGRFSIFFNPLHLVINHLEKKLFTNIENKKGIIVVLSRKGKTQIQKYYQVNSERFVIIPPIIDVQRFRGQQRNTLFRNEMRAKWNVGDKTVLLHVGSGFKIKGLDLTIRALALIRKESKAVLFVVGKDKRGESFCRSLCKKLGILDYVVFVGAQGDVGPFYALADVFVLPSLFETFGAVVIEALSFDLPVVVGSGAGVSSMIKGPAIGEVVVSPVSAHDLFLSVESQLKYLKNSDKPSIWKDKKKHSVQRCKEGVVLSAYLGIF